jgi:hypothetical protein
MGMGGCGVGFTTLERSPDVFACCAIPVYFQEALARWNPSVPVTTIVPQEISRERCGTQHPAPAPHHRPDLEAMLPLPLKTSAPSPVADAMFSQTPKKGAENQAEAPWKCERSHIPNERTQRALSRPDNDPCLVDMDEDELFRLMGIPRWRSLL